MKSFFGFYRAKVVDANPADFNLYGGIRVFIPDLHIEGIDPNFDENDGLIAYPANSPLGGRNSEDDDKESFYQGTVYTPQKNSYVWIFFEKGDPNRPYYFASFNARLSELPPENTLATEPHKVYTIIKSTAGRTIIVSDSDGDERVELTGKKRTLSGNDPAGNDSSTYTIDDNQTTIWLDERDGSEKLLIKTYKGDYINLNIEERELNFDFNGNINIKCDKKISIECDDNFEVKAKDIKLESTRDTHVKTNSSYICSSKSSIHINTKKQMRLDAKKKVKVNKGIRRKASPTNIIAPTDGDTSR